MLWWKQISRLENESDVGDEPLEMEENLHPGPLTLEDLHIKRNLKGSLPQIRDQVDGADDARRKYLCATSPIHVCCGSKVA